MALTPEQVLNKHFQTTQFRRGYEERDVDDFLDEIVAEMRSLIEQRDDYLKQLNDCRASKNQSAVRADGATAAMPAVGRPGDDAKLGGLTAKIQDAARAFQAATAARLREEAAKAPAPAPAAAAAAAPAAAAATGNVDAAGVIALAQRLHDEHVAAGETRRDELISEAENRHRELLAAAQARHDDLINTGQSRHAEATQQAEQIAAAAAAQREQMISEATSQRDQMIAEATSKRDEELDKQKGLLDRKIAELRGFEKNYRSNLKSYIEGQLHDLDSSAQEPAHAGAGDGNQG